MENKKIKSIRRTIVFAITVFLVSACTDPIEEIKQGKPCVGCDLRNADLTRVSLAGIDLNGSDLSGANLSGVEIDKNTNFDNVNFSGANLSNVDASATRNFNYVNFTDATLDNFRFGNIYGAIYPEFENPQEVISEVADTLRRIKKSKLAEEMLFKVGSGKTLVDEGESNLVDTAKLFRFLGYLKLSVNDSYEEEWGELWQQWVSAYGEDYRAINLYDKLWRISTEGRKTEYFDNFAEQGDLEFFLMLSDHVDKLDQGYINRTDFSTLEDYLYEIYIDQIDLSGIRTCRDTTVDLKSDFYYVKNAKYSWSDDHFKLAVIQQTLPQFEEEVNSYNTCVKSAYDKFNANMDMFDEQFMRVLIATFRKDYLAELEEDSEKRKWEEDRRNYTEKLSSLTRQLYDADDLIPEMIKVEALLSLQPKGMEIAQTGVDAKIWLANRMKQKSAAFERSMNICVMFDFYGEFDEKKRSKNIQKFQSAVNDRNSDEDLNARINACRYDANRAFLSG